MGEVYKATDSKLFDRVVAVKVLSEKYARNENARVAVPKRGPVRRAPRPSEHRQDLRPWAKATAARTSSWSFSDGIDLARFMKAEPNRSVERSVEIARQLSEALEFAHRHNVVHRDVKPANVMVVKRGDTEQVKLVDFGIIHVEASKMTRDGTQPGTSAYSSPSSSGTTPSTIAADLFSLGIVLYELFTNVYPFETRPARL
jgi:serine/threonine-protein kinase